MIRGKSRVSDVLRGRYGQTAPVECGLHTMHLIVQPVVSCTRRLTRSIGARRRTVGVVIRSHWRVVNVVHLQSVRLSAVYVILRGTVLLRQEVRYGAKCYVSTQHNTDVQTLHQFDSSATTSPLPDESN